MAVGFHSKPLFAKNHVIPARPERLFAPEAEAERQGVQRVEPFPFGHVEDGTGLGDGAASVDLVFGGLP
jgi:hypothetical protein